MNKNKRNNKKVVRSEFKRIQERTHRIKSNKPRNVSSTKVSNKTGFLARATTFMRRILPLKH